jgi:hypothetical protein
LLIAVGLLLANIASATECEEGYIAQEVVIQEAVAEVPEVSHKEYRHWDLMKGKWTNWSTKNSAPHWYPSKWKETRMVVDQEYAPAVPEMTEWQCVVDEEYVVPVEPCPVVQTTKKSSGEACDGVGKMFGLHIWDGHLLRWKTRSSADKIDISAYEADSTTDVYKIRVDDSGEYDLSGLPKAEWYKIRGVGARGDCVLGQWTEKVNK